jgi:broad specificity phosphatase PhoE
MTILLIRHGETALNAARIVQPADTPLSERGIAQARALARRLADGGVGAILSSDLPRATMTAEPLAALTRLPVVSNALLQERNFGELRGRAYDEIAFDPHDTELQPPGGESWSEFLARVAQAFSQLVALRATLPGPLAVVTHGLVVGAILRVHARLPAGVAMPERIANTSVSVLAADAPHAASLVNCARHLEGELADDAHGLSGF